MPDIKREREELTRLTYSVYFTHSKKVKTGRQSDQLAALVRLLIGAFSVYKSLIGEKFVSKFVCVCEASVCVGNT